MHPIGTGMQVSRHSKLGGDIPTYVLVLYAQAPTVRAHRIFFLFNFAVVFVQSFGTNHRQFRECQRSNQPSPRSRLMVMMSSNDSTHIIKNIDCVVFE